LWGGKEREREGGREGGRDIPEPFGPELEFHQEVVGVHDGVHVRREGGREGRREGGRRT